MEDTLPRLKLRMSTALSRESTEWSFLTAECRLFPTTLTMRMGLLLMSDTRERRTLSLYTRPRSTQWLTTLFTPPPSFPTTLHTLSQWLPIMLSTTPFILSTPQLLLPSIMPFILLLPSIMLRLLLVEMVQGKFRS